MTPWFRFYADALDDPKVYGLPGELFKTWVKLLGLASRHDGALPTGYAAIAAGVSMPVDTLRAQFDDLDERGLIEWDGDRPLPYAWSRWNDRARTTPGGGSTR